MQIINRDEMAEKIETIKLRREYLDFTKYIDSVLELIYLHENLMNAYCSIYAGRKNNIVCSNSYCFKKHGQLNDAEKIRSTDLEFGIYTNMVEKLSMRLERLGRISFEQYVRHRNSLRRYMFINSLGEDLLSDYEDDFFDEDYLRRTKELVQSTPDEVLLTTPLRNLISNNPQVYQTTGDVNMDEVFFAE